MVVFAKPEAGEDFLGTRFEGVVDIPIVIVLGFEFAAARRDLQNRLIADRRAFLRKKAEVRTALPFDQACVGLVLTEDDIEKGGFAGAIGANEAEPIRPRNVQRNVRKQGAGAVGLRNVGNGQHRKGDKGQADAEVKGRLGDRLTSPSRGHVGTSNE